MKKKLLSILFIFLMCVGVASSAGYYAGSGSAILCSDAGCSSLSASLPVFTDSNKKLTTKSVADTLTALGLTNAVVYKGAMDCSGNPNFPAADAGDAYVVSVDGKIGGASGIDVITGDMIICKTDGTVAGTQAAVGANWNIIEQNIDLTNIIISGGTITGITDLTVSDGGTGASTLTDHGVLVGSGTDPVTALTVGTNGQVLVGSTGADPVFATITDGEGIDTTLGAGTLSIAVEDAGEANKGILETATDSEAVAVTATDKAIVPSNLDNVFAAPPAIGGTTPNTGKFTTLESTGLTTVTGGTSYGTPVTHSATESATAATLYGHTHLVAGAYTITIPALSVSQKAKFCSTTAAVFSLDSTSPNTFSMAGTVLTAGNKITSPGGADDCVWIECVSTNVIRVWPNVTFVDGGT